MPTTLTNGIQLPDKGSVDWYSSMQSNYNLIDTHLGDTDAHVTAEDKANWNSKQGSLSQAQLDAIAQVATNTSDIATLQSGKANASHTHSSSDITDIGDYATKQYVDTSISGLVDNAPAALDTLKELSTALNDDANFASTVTTALGAKANSADLATVATSGDYDDLSNKPTINDSTITIQKNGSTVDTFTTNGSAKTIDIPVPTKTSDLTNDSDFVVSSSLAAVATSGFYNDLDNKPYIPDKISDLIDDSNFVDTSNPAVASGITSAKVTDYDTHIADTDIHVTTADKNKWNNQTYVFRYSSTALTPSSTNSNTLLDNTDNLKVGDKVIDSSGVLFSIAAIDTANSTFTIGTALIDLAQDSDVVHKSGNETISGDKVFNNRLIKNIDVALGTAPSTSKFSNIDIADNNKTSLLQILGGVYDTGNSYARFFVQNKTADDGTGLSPTGTIRSCGFNINLPATSTSDGQGSITPRANKTTDFGLVSYQWRNLWCEKLFLNGTQLDPSVFALDNAVVHLSGNETIGGYKTFTNSITLQNSDTSGLSRDLSSKSQIAVLGDAERGDNTKYRFVDKNNNEICYIRQRKLTNSNTDMSFCVNNIDNDNNSISAEINFIIDRNNDPRISPSVTDTISLGRPTFRWKNIYSNQINGLTPSSLSLPSNTGYVDISSYFTNTGDGQTNSYTASANGWIYLNVVATKLIMQIRDSNNNVVYADMCNRSSDGTIYMTIPIGSGNKLLTQWFTSSSVTITTARFIPCQGNV